MNDRVYLDWAASAPVKEECLDEANRVSKAFQGNPSSPHTEGRLAHKTLEEARARIAHCLRVPSSTLYFTSGGTESNSIVLSSFLRRPSKGRVIVSAIEHPSVWEATKLLEKFGFTVSQLNPESDGRVDPERLARTIDENTIMVALMAVNNETGSIQALKEIAAAIRKFDKSSRHIHFHCDAVQALGKIPFYPEELGVDSASFSGHKIGAPRGIGLLYSRKKIEALNVAGGQESGTRPGTENLAGACALAIAIEDSISGLASRADRCAARIQRLAEGLLSAKGTKLIPFSRLHAMPNSYSPYILCASYPGLPGETIVRAMDDLGIAISSGSACATGKHDKRVLESMGVDENTSFSSIRFSIGPETSDSEIDRAIEGFRACVKSLSGEEA